MAALQTESNSIGNNGQLFKPKEQLDNVAEITQKQTLELQDPTLANIAIEPKVPKEKVTVIEQRKQAQQEITAGINKAIEDRPEAEQQLKNLYNVINDSNASNISKKQALLEAKGALRDNNNSLIAKCEKFMNEAPKVTTTARCG